MEKELFEVIEKIGFPIVFCLVFIFRLDAKMQKLIDLNHKLVNLIQKKERK